MADAHMFVRLNNVKNSDTCSSQITGTEGDRFNKLATGRVITNADQCKLALSTEAATTNLGQAEGPLAGALSSLTGSIMALTDTGAELQSESTQTLAERERTEKEYGATAKVHGRVRAEQETVNAMESSTEYSLLSDNYQFMVWTTVAILAVIGGIHASR